ncbi:VanZ family protein [Geodermatophilus sp. SYSU D00815]
MRERRARRVLLGYLAVLAVLTLLPVIGPSVTGALVDLVDAVGLGGASSERKVVDEVTNVLLFVPAGLLLCAAFPRVPPLLAWTACVLASLGVEAAQWLVLPDRDPSLVDVATNALGAAVGVALHLVVRRRTPS